jgi:hypothetical protein
MRRRKGGGGGRAARENREREGARSRQGRRGGGWGDGRGREKEAMPFWKEKENYDVNGIRQGLDPRTQCEAETTRSQAMRRSMGGKRTENGPRPNKGEEGIY